MSPAVTHEYEIEMTPPSASTCDCCNGLTVRLTRFVHVNGDAFAVYYASYANNHPDNELAMLVSLGPWSEGSDPSERVAFYCRVRPTDDSYEVMLGDAADSHWRDADIIGKKLSRDEARAHALKATCFEVLDEAFAQDTSLRGFLHRAHCGDAASPLEHSFHSPEVIFELGEEKAGRVELGRSFAELDGERFFVRCLLPVPVEGYGHWCLGVWVELAKPAYDEVRAAWDDAPAYERLQVSGVIANDVGANLDLPVKISTGDKIDLRVRDPDVPPWLAAPGAGELADFLSKPWPKADFERYAIARGYL